MEVINWTLAKHPLNYVIVFLMLLIGMFAIHFIAQAITNKPSA